MTPARWRRLCLAGAAAVVGIGVGAFTAVGYPASGEGASGEEERRRIGEGVLLAGCEATVTAVRPTAAMAAASLLVEATVIDRDPQARPGRCMSWALRAKGGDLHPPLVETSSAVLERGEAGPPVGSALLAFQAPSGLSSAEIVFSPEGPGEAQAVWDVPAGALG